MVDFINDIFHKLITVLVQEKRILLGYIYLEEFQGQRMPPHAGETGLRVMKESEIRITNNDECKHEYSKRHKKRAIARKIQRRIDCRQIFIGPDQFRLRGHRNERHDGTYAENFNNAEQYGTGNQKQQLYFFFSFEK